MTSGPFAVDDPDGELLLRAWALNVGVNTLLVLARLQGEADTRPVLQKARDNALAHERLLQQIGATDAPLRESVATRRRAPRHRPDRGTARGRRAHRRRRAARAGRPLGRTSETGVFGMTRASQVLIGACRRRAARRRLTAFGAAVHADTRAAHRAERAESVRSLPRWPAEGAGRGDRARQGTVGRGGLGRPAGQGIQQSVRGRLPDPASRHEARGPRLHRAVHAGPAGHRGGAAGERQEGRPAAALEPVRDRHAAARRRARGGPVRQEGGRDDRRRQPVLLHHAGDQGRRHRPRRIGARSRGHFGRCRCRRTSGTSTRRRSAT